MIVPFFIKLLKSSFHGFMRPIYKSFCKAFFNFVQKVSFQKSIHILEFNSLGIYVHKISSIIW